MRGRILKIKAKKDRWFFDWEVYRKERSGGKEEER
jgi:hypothetical protein|nr:MAG TPA: hypothetical protein [Caudoviricetes sp.]